jgi:hypothetical protein
MEFTSRSAFSSSILQIDTVRTQRRGEGSTALAGARRNLEPALGSDASLVKTLPACLPTHLRRFIPFHQERSVRSLGCWKRGEGLESRVLKKELESSRGSRGLDMRNKSLSPQTK